MKTLGDRMRAAREECAREGKAMFLAALSELFAAHPKLTRFAWEQYTPYFNDGETCEFSVHDIESVTFDGVELEEPTFYATSTSDYAVKEREKWPADAVPVIQDIDALHRALSSMDDAAELAFGDHVTVIVSRGEDGPIVEIEECEHD